MLKGIFIALRAFLEKNVLRVNFLYFIIISRIYASSASFLEEGEGCSRPSVFLCFTLIALRHPWSMFEKGGRTGRGIINKGDPTSSTPEGRWYSG